MHGVFSAWKGDGIWNAKKPPICLDALMKHRYPVQVHLGMNDVFLSALADLMYRDELLANSVPLLFNTGSRFGCHLDAFFWQPCNDIEASLMCFRVSELTT